MLCFVLDIKDKYKGQIYLFIYLRQNDAKVKNKITIHNNATK